MEKPKEPQPEDYGLTADRISRLDEPDLIDRLTPIIYVSGGLCAAIAGINIYESAKSVSIWGVFGTLFVLFFVFETPSRTQIN